MSLTKVSYSMVDGAPPNTLDYLTAQDAINAGSTNSVIQVSGTPQYSASTNWKGRQHQTDDLPYNLNNFTWSGAGLNARMWVANNILYVCEYSNSKIAMFALTDMRSPTYLGSFSTSAEPRDVCAFGRYVFVCCHGAARIEVYDVPQPAIATLVGTIPTNSNPKTIQILGNEIYVANFSGTVQKFTYTLPSQSTVDFSYTLVATANAPIGPLCLSVNGQGLLLVCGLNSANVILMGSTNLNVVATVSIGSGQHGTIAFVGSQQAFVTDSAEDRLYSISVSNLGITVTGFVDTSPNPEQFEVIGNRCYVPTLTNPGVPSFLDCIDITNAAQPFLYKTVPLTMTGAGFTAFASDSHTGYVYVNGHFAPYTIDVIEVPQGNSFRLPQNANEYLQSRNAGFSSAQVGQLQFRYKSLVGSPYTSTITDGVLRIGNNCDSVTLHNPASNPGQLLILQNITTTQIKTIINPNAGGFSTTTLFPGDSVTLCAEDFSNSYTWDVISSSVSRTFVKCTTTTSGYTPLNSDDVVRVGLGAPIALPNPATMINKQIIIKNVSLIASSNVTNTFAGYSGTLAANEAVTLIATTFGGLAQWDAIASF